MKISEGRTLSSLHGKHIAGMMLEGADKATTDKLAGILAAKHII